MSDNQRLLLTVLMTLWVLSFVYAFYAFATTEPGGGGFVRGLNRVRAYLGWQAIAGMASVAIFAVGRNWPKGATVRRLSWIPLAIALAHVAAIAAIFVWARYFS